MNESKKASEVWVGIDWGDEAHAVAVVSPTAEPVEQFGIKNSPEGFAELNERLSRHDIVRGIAMESTRHTLLLYLASLKYPVYLVNPKQSKAWRKTDSVAEIKSDARDGLTLAGGLAFRHRRMEPVQPADPELQRLALLCEKESAFIAKRTALTQELKSMLKLYYPAALAVFADWTKPAAWDFLLKYPAAKKLARVQEHTLIAFLKGKRLGQSEHWRAVVKARGAAANWPVHPCEDIYQMQAEGIVLGLKAIEKTLRRFRAQIEAGFEELPQARLLESLPGAGPKLAPRLASIMLSPVAQAGGLQAVRCHSGVAPVLDESGKRRHVKIRRLCNKKWRNTMHQFANCSKRWCAWAKAFYDYRKESGDTHSTALRKLADKWLNIIMHMVQTNQTYDEKTYLNSLRRNNSPTWRYLTKNACA